MRGEALDGRKEEMLSPDLAFDSRPRRCRESSGGVQTNLSGTSNKRMRMIVITVF